MRAFEVHLNGEKLCLGGIAEHGVLTVIVGSIMGGAGRDDLWLEFGGLISHTKEHVSWLRDKGLHVGDEIRIRIVDSETTEEPVMRITEDEPPGSSCKPQA